MVATVLLQQVTNNSIAAQNAAARRSRQYDADLSHGSSYRADPWIEPVTRTSMGQPILVDDTRDDIKWHTPWWKKVFQFFTVNGTGRHRKAIRRNEWEE